MHYFAFQDGSRFKSSTSFAVLLSLFLRNRLFGSASTTTSMKYLRLILIVAAAAFSAAVAQAQQEVTLQKMTADQLIAKNVEAKGGSDAVHALRSLKITG